MQYNHRRIQHHFDGDSITNQEDFSMFFKEWFVSIAYYVFNIVDNQTVAEDIAEDSFVVLWERRHHFKNIKVARAFLYTTARNASFNWLDSKQVAEKYCKRTAYLSKTSEKSMFENIVRAEVIHELYRALNELPIQCKKVFNLIYIEGKSHREAGEIMQLSINTIKAQRARGLSILRKKLTLLFLIICSTYYMF